MKRAKIFSIVFVAFAVLLFGAMCGTVAYAYGKMQCAILHDGTSAPVGVAFFYAIPFAVAIAICLALAYVCYQKSKK